MTISVAGTATNAYAAKKSLLALTATLLAADPNTDEVEVSYGYRGPNHLREYVHGGRVEGSQEYPLHAGGRARYPRDENLVIKLHFVVRKLGEDHEAAEQRAVEIGTTFERRIASADIPDVAGLVKVGITAVDLDSDIDDDGSTAVLTYDVLVTSRLT